MNAVTGSARARIGIGALGVLVGLYGAYVLLTRQDLDQLLNLVVWLGGGVIVHDALLAPVVILLAWLFRSLPRTWLRPATVALVLLGTITVVAVPVLVGLGARSDNPTLLDRPYGWSWLALVLVGVIIVLAAGWFARSRSAVRTTTADVGGVDGPGAGRG